MLRDRLRQNMTFIHQALREPEDFTSHWHLQGRPYSWSVFAALALTAIAGTTTYGLILGLGGGAREMFRCGGAFTLAAGLAWSLPLPALYILNSLTGSRLRASTTFTEDDWARTLAVVERELDAAQASLEEWIGVPEEQRQRLEKLREAWAAQTERLREMDRLLGRPEYADVEQGPSADAAPRVRQSLTARQHNLERLRQVRQQAEADLLASLAWVRELASRIHLARFTDVGAERAEELLRALAAAVETLSAPDGAAEHGWAIKKAE